MVANDLLLLPTDGHDYGQHVGVATEPVQIGRCTKCIITTNTTDALHVKAFLINQRIRTFADLVMMP